MNDDVCLADDPGRGVGHQQVARQRRRRAREANKTGEVLRVGQDGGPERALRSEGQRWEHRNVRQSSGRGHEEVNGIDPHRVSSVVPLLYFRVYCTSFTALFFGFQLLSYVSLPFAIFFEDFFMGSCRIPFFLHFLTYFYFPSYHRCFHPAFPILPFFLPSFQNIHFLVPSKSPLILSFVYRLLTRDERRWTHPEPQDVGDTVGRGRGDELVCKQPDPT